MVIDMPLLLLSLDESSTARWHDEVYNAIGRCHLPQYYGGDLVDDNGDPKCRQVVCIRNPIN